MDIWCNECEFTESGIPCFADWVCSRNKKKCDEVLETCDIALKLQMDKIMENKKSRCNTCQKNLERMNEVRENLFKLQRLPNKFHYTFNENKLVIEEEVDNGDKNEIEKKMHECCVVKRIAYENSLRDEISYLSVQIDSCKICKEKRTKDKMKMKFKIIK